MTRPRPDDALAREAAVLTRYLLDVDCPPELSARYAAAIHRAPDSQLSTRDERVAAFAIARPWALPYIAAAAPFLSGGGLLRWKLTLMSAILETTPRFASEFLPRDLSIGALLRVLVAQSLLAALRLLVGVPMLLAARR